MRALSLCLLLLAISTTTFAQPPEPETKPAAKTISGVVLDDAGKPVPDANVRFAYNLGDPSVRTDTEGKFTLNIPDPFLQSRRPQFFLAILASTERCAGSFFEQVALDNLPELKITLEPLRHVRVTVRDQNGDPVPDADVYGVGGSYVLEPQTTDANGQCSVPLFAKITEWSIAARKSGVGFDYEAAPISGSSQEMKPLPESLDLTLSGVQPLRVKTVDSAGKPLAGIPVRLWHIATKEQHTPFNISVLRDEPIPTGPDGVAILDWIPADFESLSVSARSTDYQSANHSLRVTPDQVADELVIKLYGKETISGRVVDPAGKPLAGVGVIARGQGVGFNNGSGIAQTDSEGRYELKATVDQAYFVRLESPDWASTYQHPVILRAGNPMTNVDLTAVTPTRLHGRVTQSQAKSPITDLRLNVVSTFLGEIPEEIQSLADSEERRSYQLLDQRNPRTNTNGEYEILLGPGTYKVFFSGSSVRQEPIEITIPETNPPGEIEQNFHLERPLTGPITVTVLDPDGKPVPKALVESRSKGTSGRDWFEAIPANEQGIVQGERALEKTVLFARSPDKNMAGIGRIGEEDAEATVHLQPTATATGVLKDSKGEIAVNQSLTFGIRTYIGEEKNSAFMESFGGATTTDDQGRFSLTGLIPGESYTLTARIGMPEKSLINLTMRTVTTVKPEKAETIDLGELRVDLEPYKPAAPYARTTSAERLATSLARSAEKKLGDQLRDLRAAARQMYTRPLLLITQPVDPHAIAFFTLLEAPGRDSEDENAPKTISDMRWEFELSALSAASPEVREFAKAHQIDLSEKALPTLLLLDEAGGVAETFSLDLAKRPVVAPHPGDAPPAKPIDPAARLRDFLAQTKLPTRDAEDLLAQALATAKKDNKKVYLICSASWCGPCRALAEFLEPFHEEMDKHYVTVKLDVSRDTHAREVNQRLKGERSGGVPWHVILDPNGEELISSNRAPDNEDEKEPSNSESGPNIGHPGSPAGAKHFLKMITTTAPNFAPETLSAMKEKLGIEEE